MNTAQCSVEACERHVTARGLCRMHYLRVWRQGEVPNRPNLTLAERLMAGLERKPNGCLEWTRSTCKGYGYLRVKGGKNVLLHRVAWELVNGPIPEGMSVCHRCDNPPCCDVEHLFLGTHAENLADMTAKGRGKPFGRVTVI